jgi:DNA-binding transcriptional MerR regulator
LYKWNFFFEVKDMNQVYYNPQDVAELLEISKPTLRRWSTELENHGVVIYRDKQDRRLYSEDNLDMLKALKQRLTRGEDTMSAVNAVISRVNGQVEEGRAPSAHALIPDEERSSSLERQMFQMTKMMESLHNQVQELKEEIQEHREITKIQIQRHDQLLLEHIRQIQEVKQLENELAASKEAAEKKKKWWRFW